MSTQVGAQPSGQSGTSEAEDQETTAPVWQAYTLDNGFVHSWLVAGPLTTPLTDISSYTGPDFKEQIAADFRVGAATSGQAQDLALPAPIEIFAGALERNRIVPDRDETMWRVVRCLDDHFVDLSTFHHTSHYLQTWAYCVLDSPSACEVTFALTTNGPADIWLNREHCRRVEHFHHQLPQTVLFPTRLKQGRNEIGVCFEAVALRECPYVMALRLTDFQEEGNALEQGSDRASDDFSVFLPTSIRPGRRRQQLESIFDRAYLERNLFSRQAQVIVR